MKDHGRLAIVPSALLLASGLSLANDVPADVPLVTLPDTSRHLLHSDEMNQTFQIDVAVPPRLATASADSHPVVYLVDGNGLFPLVYANTRALQRGSEMEPVIIVGIGYPVREPFEIGALRTRDLTPTEDKAFEDKMNNSGLPLRTAVRTGHAGKLAAFVENELKPFINARYPVDTDNEIFAGYSLGGLFGLYVLFHHAHLFDKYVLGSPSIWWDQSVSFAYEDAYARQHKVLEKSVFISSGTADLEMMVTGAQAMYKRLVDRAYEGLDVKYVEFEGETHSSGIGVALNRGIKYVASNRRE